MNILDTSRRRLKWREAYAGQPCFFIGEMEMPKLEKGAIVFVHETDLAPYDTTETFVPNRLQDLEMNFGGDQKMAKKVCDRIAAFRSHLRQWVEEKSAILVIYSGDPPCKVEERNPKRAIEQNIARLPAGNVLVLPQMLPQDIGPSSLRRIAETCRFSIKNKRDISKDLKGVGRYKDLLSAARLKRELNPNYLKRLPDDIRKTLERCLESENDTDPDTMLKLLPYLEGLS